MLYTFASLFLSSVLLFLSSDKCRHRGKQHKAIDMCGRMKCKIDINANNNECRRCVCASDVIISVAHSVRTLLLLPWSLMVLVLVLVLVMCCLFVFRRVLCYFRSLFYTHTYRLYLFYGNFRCFCYFNNRLLM